MSSADDHQDQNYSAAGKIPQTFLQLEDLGDGNVRLHLCLELRWADALPLLRALPEDGPDELRAPQLNIARQ
jgi:hypothetical protein